MKGPEVLALLFTLYAFIGIAINYDVVYCSLNKRRHWWITRHHSNSFHWFHKRLRWGVYVLTILWLVSWMILFGEKGYWVTRAALAMYLATRISAWFVLGPRTAFLIKHNALKKIGPTGQIAPLPGHPATYTAQVD